ncbi:serine hydrolase [Actinoplanes sp. NPDC049265]|uniref:serine hydrolase n=1 Tax=Actinoplanes sp. NPDC049265 TaxID=3363902 RepID=UPI00371F6CB9
MRRATLTVCLIAAMVSAASPASAAEPTGPPSVTPADIDFRNDVLRTGRPGQVGLVADRVAALPEIARSYLTPTLDHPTWPAYAGASVLAAHNGVVVSRFAVGDAVRYSAVGPAPARDGVELPPEQRIPARTDTIWDLASISKLFTTVTLLQQVEAGRVDLAAPVATYVPEFGKPAITVKHLLTHTSGLPAFLPFYSSYPTPETRLRAAITTPVTAGSTPGGQYVYSDIGLIVLGVLVERITGTGLAQAVNDAVIGPLGLTDTGYNPDAGKKPRIAATEYEPYVGRGMVWGEVHDENAWSLGGVAGHAGLFSTVDDMAIFCQMLLNGGTYAGRRILAESTVRAALVNYNAGLEQAYPESDRGLGFELDKHWYMGGLSSPVTFGHTGFTGTTITIDPLAHSFLIVFSNRVHPDRNWGSNNVARRALAGAFADAHPVRPPSGGRAWRALNGDQTTTTLTASLREKSRSGAVLSAQLWYDTEPRNDVVRVETSADGVTWTLLPLHLRAPGAGNFDSTGTLTGFGGRVWWQTIATLPAGVQHVRFSYTTDVNSQGRGVYVDRVLVDDHGATLFRGDGFRADGWALTNS